MRHTKKHPKPWRQHKWYSPTRLKEYGKRALYVLGAGAFLVAAGLMCNGIRVSTKEKLDQIAADEAPSLDIAERELAEGDSANAYLVARGILKRAGPRRRSACDVFGKGVSSDYVRLANRATEITDICQAYAP